MKHYGSLDEQRPVWSGAMYKFDVTNIQDDDWELLENVVATYFDVPKSTSGESQPVVFNFDSQVTRVQM